MDGLGVCNPQAFFLRDTISEDRTAPSEKKHTPNDPFQREMAPYSSRSLFSGTANSADILHHAWPVEVSVSECH